MIIDTDTSSIGSLKTLTVEVRIAMVCLFFFFFVWLASLNHIYSSSPSGILDFSYFSDIYFEWVCNNNALF